MPRFSRIAFASSPTGSNQRAPAEGEVVFARHALRRVPQRVLPTIGGAEDRPLLLLLLVDGPRAQGPPGRPLFVGVNDAVAGRIVVQRPAHHIALGGPGTEARHVEGEEVEVRLAVDHPFCDRTGEACPLAEAGDNAAADEVVVELRHRAEQRRHIGGPDHRPVDHPLDPGGAQHRNALASAHDVVGDAIEIVGQQLVAELQRGAVDRPEAAVFLVGAAEQALALLAQVVALVAVVQQRDLLAQGLDLGDRLGDEILVFHGHQRQIDPGQLADLAAPETGGVDHRVGFDGALRRHHLPGAVGLRVGLDHRRMTVDLGAAVARALGKGVGNAAGVDVAFVGLEHADANVRQIQERVHRQGFFLGDDLEVDAGVFRLGALDLELVLAFLGGGEIDAADGVDAAGLSGFRL